MSVNAASGSGDRLGQGVVRGRRIQAHRIHSWHVLWRERLESSHLAALSAKAAGVNGDNASADPRGGLGAHLGDFRLQLGKDSRKVTP